MNTAVSRRAKPVLLFTRPVLDRHYPFVTSLRACARSSHTLPGSGAPPSFCPYFQVGRGSSEWQEAKIQLFQWKVANTGLYMQIFFPCSPLGGAGGTNTCLLWTECGTLGSFAVIYSCLIATVTPSQAALSTAASRISGRFLVFCWFFFRQHLDHVAIDRLVNVGRHLFGGHRRSKVLQRCRRRCCCRLWKTMTSSVHTVKDAAERSEGAEEEEGALPG